MLDQPPTATARTRRTGEDRIFTIPNVITVIRLSCIPVFLYLLFGLGYRFPAALLLGALGATDCLDGYIARRYDQVSALGRSLDPIADRILLGVGVVAILIDGSVPVPVAAAVLTREGLVALGAIVLAALGATNIGVTLAGKAGTFANLAAFPFFLGGNDDKLSWNTTATWIGWSFAIPGLLLSWYAAAAYLPLARRALREGRAMKMKETP